jgi:hypothetical protein
MQTVCLEKSFKIEHSTLIAVNWNIMNSVLWVRERTTPNEPQLNVAEVSDNFGG